MYTPDPNSNIGQLFAIIPSNKSVSCHELNKIISNIDPKFPTKSTNTHLRFLEKKGLVYRQRFEGVSYYSREKQFNEVEHKDPESSILSEPKLTLGGKILEYCKQKVGKRITSAEIKTYVNADNTGYLDILKRLKMANAIQLIEGTSPWEYLVLPDIKVLDKVPTKREIEAKKTPSIVHKPENILKLDSNIKNNIANMSLSDILSEYVVLKQENTRFKEALQRMGMEFLQLGILEEED